MYVYTVTARAPDNLHLLRSKDIRLYHILCFIILESSLRDNSKNKPNIGDCETITKEELI